MCCVSGSVWWLWCLVSHQLCWLHQQSEPACRSSISLRMYVTVGLHDENVDCAQRRTWRAVTVGGQLALSLYSSNDLSELSHSGCGAIMTVSSTLSIVLLRHVAVDAACGGSRQSSVSVCLSRSWALLKQLNWSRCRLRWAKEPCVRWGSRSLCMNGQLWGRKAAVPGNGLGSIYWKWLIAGVGRMLQCGCRLGCTGWGADWRHLANMN